MEGAKGRVGLRVIHMPRLEPEAINSMFITCDVVSSEDINAVFTMAEMGDVGLIRAIHSSSNCRSARMERHFYDKLAPQLFACIPISGKMGIHHMGRACEVRAGTLGFVRTDREYSIDMSDNLDALWVRIPKGRLQPFVTSSQDALCRPINVGSGIGLAATQLALTSVLVMQGELSERGAALLSQSLTRLIGELVEETVCANAEYSTKHCRKIFARAKDFIEENLGDENLSPQLIAETLGISRRYLSQIFTAQGTSVMRWVQYRRLERCHAEITGACKTRQPIQEIAYSMGFSNISSFNRAFKAHFGKAPRQLLSNESYLTQ